MTQPDALEPYTVSVRFTARTGVPSPADLVGGLLEDIARRCEEEGCSIIGHLKCHASEAESAFSCSLTRRRSGTACRGDGREPMVAGEALDVQLAVLVYGLSRATIEAVVMDSLAATAQTANVDVSTSDACATHDHAHEPPPQT